METHTNQSKISLINHHNWSKNRFAWFYAVLILLAAVAVGVLCKINGVYEAMYIRSINIFFILIAFFAMIWDYKRSKQQHLGYIEAFLFCARTGFYFCLMYLPIILVFLIDSNNELNLVKANETFDNSFSIIAIVFSTYIETVCFVIISGLVAAFTGSTGRLKS